MNCAFWFIFGLTGGFCVGVSTLLWWYLSGRTNHEQDK